MKLTERLPYWINAISMVLLIAITILLIVIINRI